MDDFQSKFNSLDPASQQEVVEFIDRLISNNKKAPKSRDDYKNKILSVSQWSEEDIKPIEEGMRFLKPNP